MVLAVLCPTGFSGGEDALWEARGSVAVHHRGRLHAISQPSPHHSPLWHCAQLTPHAGKEGTVDREIFTLKIIHVKNFVLLNFHDFVQSAKF